ncbi:MAG: DUF6504 family protein [Nocardioidaceae bacterium]
MRRYDDPVDVRRGRVAGAGDGSLLVEGPEQFLWRGRLWKVSAVVAHWVETGAWWQSAGADAVRGTDPGNDLETGPETGPGHVDLSAEREVWRVEAGRGLSTVPFGRGVFDLVFDWADGSWRLTRCLD